MFRRVPVRITYKMRNRVYGLETEGLLADLSLGGVGFVAPVNWPEGSQIHVTVGAFGFQSDCVIVYRRPAGEEFFYGAKFQSTSLRHLSRLQKILKKNHDGPLTV